MRQLWPTVEHGIEVYGVVELQIFQQESGSGKPVIRIQAGNKVLYVSGNIAEMIGGAAVGARKLWEEHQ